MLMLVTPLIVKMSAEIDWLDSIRLLLLLFVPPGFLGMNAFDHEANFPTSHFTDLPTENSSHTLRLHSNSEAGKGHQEREIRQD